MDFSVEDHVYLSPRAKLQPVCCRWPAWPHLISPAQHAMNLAFRHIPSIKSFVRTPSVHVAASRDPALLGGPFVSLPEEHLPDAQRWLADSSQNQAHLLKFAEDLRALDARLQGSAKGYCLDPQYESVPESLAGLVELVYDLNSHPKIRLHEELLYAGGLDDSQCHEICLRPIRDEDRDFFMSAPLLDGQDRLFLKTSFADAVVDRLSTLRFQPQRLGEVLSWLGVESLDDELLRSLFTAEAPVRNAPAYAGDGIRVRYFGHACVLLQTRDVSILVDPLTAWEPDEDQATLTFTDLPDHIDYVIITHCHQDHCVPEMLVQLRHRVGQVIVPRNDAGNLADPSMKLILNRLGYTDVLAVSPLDTIEIAGGRIVILPFVGEHSGLDINSKLCASVQLLGHGFVFLVDTDGVDPSLYRRTRPFIGRTDTLFLGMECQGAPLTWAYGPLLTKPINRRDDESRRLSGANSARAWSLAETFGASQVFIYAMGQERWLRSLMGLEYQPESIQLSESDAFIARCRDSGIEAERLKGCREMLFPAQN